MPDLDALHAEVLRHPEADEPRLAYADAIADVDPDRAELIRVQLEITRARRAGRELMTSDTYRREQILLGRHKATWSKSVLDLRWVTGAVLMRGFVEYVRAPADAFLAHGDHLYTVAPVLHVDLTDVAPHVTELFASPLLDRIHSLGLWRNRLGDDAAVLLATSSHVHRLRWLDLSHNKIGEAGLEAICASTKLAELRYFNFAYNLAPDPTPKIGEVDTFTNQIMSIDVPPAARELERRFGKKPWMSPVLGTHYPPGRDAV